MNDTMESFQDKVLDRLRKQKQQLHLGEPQAGKGDELLAASVVNGLRGGLKDRVLAIVKRPHALVTRLHGVLFVGTTGDASNRTCRHTLRRLFATTEEQIEQLEDDQWMLLGVLADNYRHGSRTTEDLLAHLVNGSNDWTIWTKAYIDWRDGEVLVETIVPCDFESLPASFDDDVLAVLGHASRLIRLEELVRLRLSSDTQLSQRTLAGLAEKLAGVFEIKKPEAGNNGDASGSHEEEGALTL